MPSSPYMWPYGTVPNPGYYDSTQGTVQWIIAAAGILTSSSAMAPTLTFDFNPPFDADSSPNTEANVNKGINLGASVNYFQVMSINSPVRELGGKGSPIFITRPQRDAIWKIYRLQLTQDQYCVIFPRTPYTGSDGGPGNRNYVKVFMHPLKTERMGFGAGDIYQLSATFTYLEVASYL